MSEGLRGADALGAVAAPAAVTVALVTASGLGAGTAVAAADSAVELGQRIKAARMRREMRGEELGAVLGLDKTQISKIEGGVRRVNVRELPQLARALGVAIGELLGEPARPRMAMAHRLAAGVAEAPAATRRRALQLIEVEDLLSRRTQVPSPSASAAGTRVTEFARATFNRRPRNKAEARRQGRELAVRVRTELRLGAYEIGDLPGLIEREFGVDVAVSPLGADADGLCVHGDGVAMIVASSDFSDGHVRFTLAHELGHHILDDSRDIIDEQQRDMFGDDLAERRVNAFAAHLLMPTDGVRQTVAWSGGGVNDRVLVALMSRFGVSLSALVGQLIELRLVPFDDGPRLRELSVGALQARHRDLAPDQSLTIGRRNVRPPARLIRTAIQAAQAQTLGLSPVATLLQREDDEELWDEVMVRQYAVAVAGAAPTR